MPDILLQIYVNILIMLAREGGTDIRNSSICKSGVQKIVVGLKGKISCYCSERVKADVPTSAIKPMETSVHADLEL